MSERDEEAIVPALAQAPSLIARWRGVVASRAAEVAVVCGEEAITYGELERKARLIAASLVARGVAAPQRVAVCAAPSIDGTAAMLGALYAGAACVALEPRWEAARLGELVALARPSVILHDEEHAALAAGLAGGAIDAAGAALRACALAEALAPTSSPLGAASELPPSGLGPDGLAYVTPTSGDGPLRAAWLRHADVLHGLRACEAALEPSPDDVWGQLHSPAFHLSLWEIWGALAFGGRLVLPATSRPPAPAELLAFATRHGLTVLSLTPWQLSRWVPQLARAPEAERARLKLSFLLIAGDVLQAGTARRWFELMGENAVVVNAYGTAETGGPVVLGALSPADVERDLPAPLGAAVDGVTWQLLDEQGRSVPRGAAGELVLERGAVGFAGRFDSAASADDARRLRTGDLARQAADGGLVVIERLGASVMTRGVRVSPGEVAVALLGCRGVAAALALGAESGEENGEEIEAYLVPAGAPLDAELLRRELRDRVPGFLHPHALRVIEEVPLTTAGRPDRAALRGAGQELTSRRRPAEPTAEEARMLEVWRHALQVPELGVEDDFFAAGGTSIRAVELVIALRTAGFATAVRDLLRSPNVRELVARIGGGKAAAAAPDPTPAATAVAVTDREEGAVADLQQVMLEQYARHAATGNGVYHVQESFLLIDRQLDAARLLRCFADEIAREPAFRTYFVRDEGRYWRRRAAEPQVELAGVDLRGHTPDEQAARLEAHVQADLARPFPLDGPGALHRFTVFELSATSARVFSSAHHANDDGWSQQQFLRWVVAAYRGAPEPRQLPAADPYDAYVAAQAAAAADPETRAHLRQLALDPDSLAALDRPPPARYLEVSRDLPRDLVLELLARAARAQLQAKALFLTAAVAGLAEHTDAEALTVGVVVNGRLPEVPGMLEAHGLYWNLQAFTWSRASRSPGATGATGANDEISAAAAVHAELVRLERFALAPLSALLAERAPGQELRTTFNYTNFPAVGALGELETRDWRARDTWHYPMNLGVHLDLETHEHQLRIAFDPAYCSEPEGARLLAHIADHLERMAGGAR